MLNNLRGILQPTLEKIGKAFASTGLSANFWTWVGLVFALASALVYGLGIEFGLIIGGILLLVSGFLIWWMGKWQEQLAKPLKRARILIQCLIKLPKLRYFWGYCLADMPNHIL